MRNVRLALGRRWAHDQMTAGGLDVGKRRHSRQQEIREILTEPAILAFSFCSGEDVISVCRRVVGYRPRRGGEAGAGACSRKIWGPSVRVPASWFWGRISVRWRGRAYVRKASGGVMAKKKRKEVNGGCNR